MLTIYGVTVLTFMMVMYALEGRDRRFVLAFAVGCALSNSYGFASGAWPFGVVEAAWCLIALDRFYRGTSPFDNWQPLIVVPATAAAQGPRTPSNATGHQLQVAETGLADRPGLDRSQCGTGGGAAERPGCPSSRRRRWRAGPARSEARSSACSVVLKAPLKELSRECEGQLLLHFRPASTHTRAPRLGPPVSDFHQGRLPETHPALHYKEPARALKQSLDRRQLTLRSSNSTKSRLRHIPPWRRRWL